MKELFNEDWTVRPKTSPYAQLQGLTAAKKEICLPHDATISEARSADAPNGGAVGYFPSGTYEYSKTVEIPAEYEGKKVFLDFDGAHRDAMVYVNGAFVAQRPNGYIPFSCDITPYLRFGDTNEIVVEVRSYRDSRWYTGTGIYRDVYLHVVDPIHIDIQSPLIHTVEISAELATVEITTAIENSTTTTKTVRVQLNVLDGTGDCVASTNTPVTLLPGESTVSTQRIWVRNPQLWHPESPNLYTAQISLLSGDSVVDEKETSFGIRTVSVDPINGFQLNGETLKLRGACIHHDNGLLGAVENYYAAKRKVSRLKDAGFNAVRSSHNPISETMLDVCDELGMMVLDETFDMWAKSKTDFDYSLAFPQWWEKDVEAMVVRDYNHPSVIMYSIGNEILEAGDSHGAVWGRRLVSAIRSIDTTRPITNAINGFVAVLSDLAKFMGQAGAASSTEGGVNAAADFMNKVSASDLVTYKTEESFAVLDVAGMNYSDSRYLLDQKVFPDRVILGTETFPPRIAKNWELVTSLPNVIGDFTWTGWDYLGEVGIGRIYWEGDPKVFEAPYPWMTAWVGDFDITGNRRPISYYRQAVFGLLDTPYIAVQDPENYSRIAHPSQWSWSDTLGSWTWNVPEGTKTAVEVYSTADEVELFINGQSQGRLPVGPEAEYIATFDVQYQPGTIEAVAYVDGNAVSRTELSTAEGARVLRATPDRSQVRAASAELSFIDIECLGSNGTVDTTATGEITVSVSGEAELVALGSGKPNPSPSATPDTTALFEGRALAIVRPLAPGTATVTGSSPDYGDTTVEIVIGD